MFLSVSSIIDDNSTICLVLEQIVASSVGQFGGGLKLIAMGNSRCEFRRCALIASEERVTLFGQLKK